MIVTTIDLGSNSLKLLVADPGPPLVVVHERADITRIGEGLDKNGFLLDVAQDRTLAMLRTYVDLARSLGAQKIRCVGTAGLRGAANAPEFLAKVKDQIGLEIEIIHGLREAELAFLAPSLAFPGTILVADVGGRSTELILGHHGQILEKVSLELGGVRMTERFLRHDPPLPDELELLQRYLREALAQGPAAPEGTQLIGVSGTVVALMGLHLGATEIEVAVTQGEGQPLPKDAVLTLYRRLSAQTTQERLRGSVVPAGRADVIVAGAAIILALMERYGEPMYVSNRGVRFGLLAELR